MASEKMSPISAIIHELKQHCEDSGVVKKAMLREQDPRKRQVLEFGWHCEKASIRTLCDVLKITAIPDEEKSKVISELEALGGYDYLIQGPLQALRS